MSYITDTSTPASKVIHLDSGDAHTYHHKDAEGNEISSSFLFHMSEAIVCPEHLSMICSLHSCTIPYTFYNVRNDVNNAVVFTYGGSQLGALAGDYKVVFPSGSYTALSFLNEFGEDGRTLYPRGFPYWLRHPLEEKFSDATGRLTCVMGLWKNVLDYDGIDKYLFEDYESLRNDTKLVEPLLTVGTPDCPTKFSFCAMNFAFHRDMLPAAYQMPMDREISKHYPIWRFDDIWAGYVIEALVHKRGGQDLIGIGEPVGTHLKEGNLKREVLGEHYGHLMSPYFYSMIDAGVDAAKPGTYAAMYQDVFGHLVEHFTSVADDVRCPPLYREYFIETFTRLYRWSQLFEREDSDAPQKAVG